MATVDGGTSGAQNAPADGSTQSAEIIELAQAAPATPPAGGTPGTPPAGGPLLGPDGLPLQGQGAPGGLPGAPGGLPGAPGGLPGAPGGLPGAPGGLPGAPGGLPGAPGGGFGAPGGGGFGDLGGGFAGPGGGGNPFGGGGNPFGGGPAGPGGFGADPFAGGFAGGPGGPAGFGPGPADFGPAPGGFGPAPGGFGPAPGGFGPAPGGFGPAPGGDPFGGDPFGGGFGGPGGDPFGGGGGLGFGGPGGDPFGGGGDFGFGGFGGDPFDGGFDGGFFGEGPVEGPIDEPPPVEFVPPPEGPTFTEVLVATVGDDSLAGGSGDTSFSMSLGTTLGGTDEVTDQGGTDQLTLTSLANFQGLVDLNLASAVVTYTSAATGTITLTDVEQIFFSDGTSQDAVGLTQQAGKFGYVLVGTAGVDALNLTAGQTVHTRTIQASDSAGGVVIGGGGVDTITGSDASDLLHGGAGDDIFNSSVGNDTYRGNDDNDTVNVSDASHVATSIIAGGAGTDTLSVSATGVSALNLSAAALSSVETINLNGGAAGGVTLTMASLTGVTSIVGDAAADILTLTTSADLSGLTTFSLDTINFAAASANTIGSAVAAAGAAGATTLTTSSGNATLASAIDLDASGMTFTNITSLAFTGARTLTVDAATNLGGMDISGTGITLTSLVGMDLSGVALSGVTAINLDTDTGGTDTLTVNATTTLGTATITGTGGNEVINASAGNLDVSTATLSNIGTLSTTAAAATITITDTQGDAVGTFATGGGAGVIQYTGGAVTADFSAKTLTNVTTIIGTGNADTIIAKAGNQILQGGAGADTLRGAAGADTLTGGADGDTFDFNALTEGVSSVTHTDLDTLNDFTVSQGDVIDLIDIAGITEAELDAAGNSISSLGAVAGVALTNALDTAFGNAALNAAGKMASFTHGGSTYLAIEDGTGVGTFTAGQDFIIKVTGSTLTSFGDANIIGDAVLTAAIGGAGGNASITLNSVAGGAVVVDLSQALVANAITEGGTAVTPTGGTYAQGTTVNVDASGATGFSNTNSLVMTGGGENNSFTLATGVDEAAITIDGGAHTGGNGDVLALSGAGNFDFNATDGITNIETVTVDTGATLAITAASASGLATSGAGTTAISALHSTLAADLSSVTTTTKTAAFGVNGTFTGNLGTVTTTVANGVTLTAAASVVTGKTIGEAGGDNATVAVTGLEGTLAADLSGITTNAVTAAFSGTGTFTGNLGTAVTTLANGAAFTSTTAIVTGKTIGDGVDTASVTLSGLGTAAVDLSNIDVAGTKQVTFAGSATLNAGTNLGTFTTVISDGQTLTGTAAQLSAKAVASSGGGANDGAVAVTALHSTLNADLSGITANGTKTATFGGSGTFAGNLGNVTTTVTTGNTFTAAGTVVTAKLINGAGNVAVTGLGSTLIDLSGITVSGTKTIDVGATATINAGQSLTGFAVTIANGQTMTATSAQITGLTVTDAATGNISLTGLGSTLVNLANVSLAGTTTINMAAGATLNASTNLNGFAVTLDNNQAIGMTAAQAANVSAITGGNTGTTLTVTDDVNLNLSTTAVTGVKTINAAALSTAGRVITVDAADLNNVTAITGGAGSTTLTLGDTDDLSGITFTNVEVLTFGNFATTVTGAQAAAFTTITGGGTGTLTAQNDANFNLSTTAVTGVGTINAAALSTADRVITADAADLNNVTAITGNGSASTTLTVNDTDDLTGITLTNIEKIIAGEGATLTLNETQATGATHILGTNGGGAENISITIAGSGANLDLSGKTTTDITTFTITGEAGSNTITGTGAADVIIGGAGADILNGGAGADIYRYTAVTDGSTTPGSGDTIATANFATGSDKFSFLSDGTSVFGDAGLSGDIAFTDVVFNTNEGTTLGDLTTAAGTDREGFFVELTGSTFNGTLFDAIDTALANGAAATGKGFIVIDDGTDTKLLYDSDFATAGAGTLVEVATVTGLADGTGIGDADVTIAA